MRVLHVMEATIGGTRRHLVDVARGMRRRGVDVHVAVATARDPDFPADLAALEAEGVGVRRLPMVREVRPGRDWRDFLALRRLLRELQPDVVHTHSSKAGVLGREASWSTGIGARVHTPHTFAFLFEALFGPLKRRFYRSLEVRLARRTDRLIAVSPTEAETFRAAGIVAEEKIRIVANGVDPTLFEGVPPLDLAELGLDPERPTAAVIGLLYAAKGQDLALRALAHHACADLQLVVAGPGDRREVDSLVSELGLADRVRVTGPRRDVPALLAAIDFLVLPSRWEGMPYIVMEAMASGLPVLATPVDGARDLVVHGETGLFAGAVGVEALREGMRALVAMSPAQRGAMGRAGRERVCAAYSVEAMLDGLLDVYAEVA